MRSCRDSSNAFAASFLENFEQQDEPPWSLAYLLEAAGPLALERCGAILDRWAGASKGL